MAICAVDKAGQVVSRSSRPESAPRDSTSLTWEVPAVTRQKSRQQVWAEAPQHPYRARGRLELPLNGCPMNPMVPLPSKNAHEMRMFAICVYSLLPLLRGISRSYHGRGIWRRVGCSGTCYELGATTACPGSSLGAGLCHRQRTASATKYDTM
jgi:hypothetical protein